MAFLSLPSLILFLILLLVSNPAAFAVGCCDTSDCKQNYPDTPICGPPTCCNNTICHEGYKHQLPLCSEVSSTSNTIPYFAVPTSTSEVKQGKDKCQDQYNKERDKHGDVQRCRCEGDTEASQVQQCFAEYVNCKGNCTKLANMSCENIRNQLASACKSECKQNLSYDFSGAKQQCATESAQTIQEQFREICNQRINSFISSNKPGAQLVYNDGDYEQFCRQQVSDLSKYAGCDSNNITTPVGFNQCFQGLNGQIAAKPPFGPQQPTRWFCLEESK